MNGIFFCNKCGAQNEAGTKFCSRCGTPTFPTAAGAATPVGPSAAAASGAMPSNTAASYSAPAAATSYPTTVPVAGVRYGGFWIRVVAAIIDSIIVRIVVAPITMVFGLLGLAGSIHGTRHFGLHLLGSGITVVAVLFGSWLYEALMESSSYQATLGKMIFGMKVTDLNGNRISFERATGRHFAKWLSAMVLFIGYIMVGFTERKQGLHDLLAGTVVLRS
jgi:uncharacterized RDD family membrane protein YckC